MYSDLKLVSDEGSYLSDGYGCGTEPCKLWKEGFRNTIAFCRQILFNCFKRENLLCIRKSFHGSSG